MAIYKLRNVATEKYLNIAGSNLLGSHLDGQDVTIWTDSGAGEQLWILPSLPSSNTYVRSYMNRDVGLNAQRSSTTKYNCNVRKITGNESDTAVTIESATGGYKIKLKNYNMYLTVNTSTNGTSVYWSVGANTNYQIWKPVSVDVIEYGAKTTIDVNENGGKAGLLPADKRTPNARYIYNYLKRKGFTHNSACAVLGNVEAECGMNPGAWQTKDNLNLGYGLLQWTAARNLLYWLIDVGLCKSSSAVALNELARYSPQTLMDAELTYFMWTCELSGNYFESSNWPFNKFMRSIASVEDLAEVFYYNYVQPDDETLQKRIDFAVKWDEEFK